ncbi:hypothetical protein N8855_00960 [bacterium]|nr:hypothetical protein [bacterium]
MFYRRIKSRFEQENWFAVAIDFFIVVFGIFAGFQLTEWNADRNDRLAEVTILERLIDEYQENLELLAADRDISESTVTGTAYLLSLIAPKPDPNISDENIALPLVNCLTNPKFIPALGVTNSHMASGDIKLIQSAQIQSRLSQWQAQAQVLIEWEEIERMHGEELILGFTYDYVAWPNIDQYLGQFSVHDSPSKLTSEFQDLFSSKRFEGLLSNRVYNVRASIERIVALEADTQALIELLQARLKEIS